MAEPDRSLALRSSHSHLYRGARVTGVLPASGLPLRAGEVELAFSDGTEVAAELLEGSGSLILSVPGYRTAAGRALAAAVWPVVLVSADQAAGLVTLKLGQRIG